MSRFRLITFVVVAAGCALLCLMFLSRNIAALSVLHKGMTRENTLSRWANLQLNDEQKRLWGALLLTRGEYASAQTVLKQYLNHISPDDKLAHMLLADAYYAQGNLLSAGHALERASMLSVIPKIKGQPSLRASLEITRMKMLEASTVSLAQEASARGDHVAAVVYARLARGLTHDPFTNAETFYVEALADLAAGRHISAVLNARFSLDILPPSSTGDKRLVTQSRAVSQFAIDNHCHAQPDMLLLATFAIYEPDRSIMSTSCSQALLDSTMALLPAEKRPFVLLNRAITDVRTGELDRARTLFAEAERLGLPPIWSHVLLAGYLDSELLTRSEPTYSISDEALVGYELDPVQVELGLPLDVILFYRTDNPSTYRLQWYRSVNLAPDPGFEFVHLMNCSSSTEGDCGLPGFAGDIYGAPPSVHLVTRAERPIAPNIRMMPQWSAVLRLVNGVNPLRRSGITSFPRAVVPGTRYLQAGWIRSIGGHGFIGRKWESTKRDPPFDYAVADYTDNSWQYVSHVVIPPTETNGFELWLLNYDSEGDVEFDESIFIALP